MVTNLDNDNFVTSSATISDKDQRVTDNGDGTLTILVLATGNVDAVRAGREGDREKPRPDPLRVPGRPRRHPEPTPATTRNSSSWEK